MAHHKSAIKRIRQSEERRLRNRARRTRMRNLVRSLLKEIEAGNAERSQELLAQTSRILDKTATNGVIHRNKAARMKSRLTRKVRALSAG